MQIRGQPSAVKYFIWGSKVSPSTIIWPGGLRELGGSKSSEAIDLSNFTSQNYTPRIRTFLCSSSKRGCIKTFIYLILYFKILPSFDCWLIVNCIISFLYTPSMKMVNSIIVCNLPTIIILDIQFEKLTIFMTHICRTNHINVCQNQNYICPALTNESPGLGHAANGSTGSRSRDTCLQACSNVCR